MLTNTAIEGAKKKDRAYMILDGDGLYLKILPTGRKTWVLRYWINGQEMKKTLGVYPIMTAANARRTRDEIKTKIKAGVPLEVAKSTTFGEIAERWYKTMMEPKKAESYLYTIRLRMKYLAALWTRPIDEISRKECFDVLSLISASGRKSTAKRTGQIVGQIFDYATAAGEATINVAAGLNRSLPSEKVRHFDAVTKIADMRKLLNALDYVDDFIFRSGLQILAYCFVRRSELLRAEWSEIDFDRAEWIIPAAHIKGRRDHLVPLSKQALEIFRRLKKISPKVEEITGSGNLILPASRGANTGSRVSNSTLLKELKSLYKKLDPDDLPSEPMTLHGFRTMASTFLNEFGWAKDVIECELAHLEENESREAYNRAMYAPERRLMMQWYADALDAVKAGRDITPVPENIKNMHR